MEASSVIDCCFLLGGENTPVLADILFSAFVQVQRARAVSLLSCLLTNSTSLRGSLCFTALGIRGPVRGTDWGGGVTSAFLKEAKAPQD